MKTHTIVAALSSGLPDFQQELAGEILTIDFSIKGTRFIGINAGSEFRPNPSISFTVTHSAALHANPESTLRQRWESLRQDGTVLMELDSYEFSPLYGWVEDKYGVSWQLTLQNDEQPTTTPPRPEIIPSLLFNGEQVNRAEEAINAYTSIFPHSRLNFAARYPEDSGHAKAGSIMYADFLLADQWFIAMDSGADHNFTFSEGVSLLVECDTQEEIDHYWEALSHVPEAEQCGWCKDKFGVSWQIAPRNIDEFVTTNIAAFTAMLSMKKIDIAVLKAAQ
ncbi:VOC family protein [Timonella sp. A28]|uniref:VOC family protein n=1 Tax=Timonella sp. A28 TaxID=3442640 RepID=UPI003EB7432F